MMGKNMLRLLKFAIQYQGWQTYGTDRSTVDALGALSAMGLIEMNEYCQFRLDQPNELRTGKIKDKDEAA